MRQLDMIEPELLLEGGVARLPDKPKAPPRMPEAPRRPVTNPPPPFELTP